MPSVPASVAPDAGGSSQGRPARPRLLFYGMYDDRVVDRAATVRIRLLGGALARQAVVERIVGGRLRRAVAALGWVLRGGLGRIDAVYVETSTSSSTPADLVLLGLARMAGRPVGIYFRDAYQLYRNLYPIRRPRQRVADALWRLTTPLLRLTASVRFAPSAGLARTLRLADTIILRPGTDPSQPDLGAGNQPLVGYVGASGASDGFDRLLDAVELVRRDHKDVRLLVVGPMPPGLPPWVEAVRAGRDGLAHLMAPVRVCVIPRPINAYTDVAVPIKLMDYLGWGKPIVATRTAETTRLLQSSDAALLVDDSAPAIAEGIARVLDDDALARRLARAARSLAEDPAWTWDSRARTVIDQLVSRGPGEPDRAGGRPEH